MGVIAHQTDRGARRVSPVLPVLGALGLIAALLLSLIVCGGGLIVSVLL